MLLVALPAAAQTTLYVNGATEDDARTRAQNTASTPWRTIGRAAWGSTAKNAPVSAQAAQAGDTVMIAAGTYNYSGPAVNDRFNPLYNPVNQGTSSTNVIRFLTSGNVTLTAPTTASPVIGCLGRNHVVWQGPFSLDERNISIRPDTGTVVMVSTTGCELDGIIVDGNGSRPYDDNHTGVRIENCQSCFLRNSTIHNILNAVGNFNHNGSGVML